jgi:MoxR-like ATPase
MSFHIYPPDTVNLLHKAHILNGYLFSLHQEKIIAPQALSNPLKRVAISERKTIIQSMTENNSNTIEIDGIKIHLTPPVDLDILWAGREDLLMQILAAWMVVDETDIPLSPRIVGPPGVGKTTLAYTAAKNMNRDIYFFQATMDTRPEDLIVQPVLESGNKLKYVASSLLSAVIRGGICILDEGNRMSEKSWASLAPLLDRRRYVESVIAGLRIKAHEDFRFCTTMNEDASTFDLPEYIHSRLQPQIFIDFPEAEEELLIMSQNLPFSEESINQYVVSFLQRAHEEGASYSVRDGINIARYAIKLGKAFKSSPKTHLVNATNQILGTEALVFLPKD